MQQQKVDRADAEPIKTVGRRAWKIGSGEMRRPDFGGEEYVLTLDGGGFQAFADGALVIVHFRGVDMPVAEIERRLHHLGANPAAQIPGAEAKQRYAGAMGTHRGDLIFTRTHFANVSVQCAPVTGACRRAPRKRLAARARSP